MPIRPLLYHLTNPVEFCNGKEWTKRFCDVSWVNAYEPSRSDRLNRAGETAQCTRNLGPLANQSESYGRSHPASQAGTIRAFFLGQRAARRVAESSVGEYEQGRSFKEDLVTKPVRYQEGHLYVHHDAWYVRYWERVRQHDGSIKLQQRAKKLGQPEGLSARIPDQAAVRRIPAPAECRQCFTRSRDDAHGICRKILSEVYRRKARVDEKELHGNLEQSHMRSRRAHSCA